MSYDLAVWADASPFSGLRDDDAYALLSEHLENDDALAQPATDAIVAFVESLLAKWPALGEPGDERSPWAMGPEIGDAFGSCIYITMTYGGAEEAVPVIAATAREHGLICYDPQFESAI
jgi:hypothetical protein